MSALTTPITPISQMPSSTDLIHPFKYTFGYATGFIFLLGIMIYLYLLVIDYLENPTQHSVEESVWIYLFLCILIIGFILSYYSITCCIKKSIENEKKHEFGRFGGSKMNIPTRPSIGQNKTLHTSRFIV
jgi:nitrate reductase gamma subunit